MCRLPFGPESLEAADTCVATCAVVLEELRVIGARTNGSAQQALWFWEGPHRHTFEERRSRIHLLLARSATAVELAATVLAREVAAVRAEAAATHVWHDGRVQ